MTEALRRTDVADALFFLGVLLAVAALETSGTLTQPAQLLSELVPNDTLVAAAIGAVSAVVDNVPLVAAAIGMYDMTTYPADANALARLTPACGPHPASPRDRAAAKKKCDM